MQIPLIQWSESRVKILRECKRRYYYYYFLSDKGWLKSSSEECKKAYLLKKVTNGYMWAGTVVHDVIQSMIDNNTYALELAQTKATQKFNAGVTESRTKGWKQNISKGTNLAEHYYGDKFDLNYYIQRIDRCMKALFKSKIFAHIQTLNDNDKITVEEFQNFSLNTNEIVSVKMDFAFRAKDNVYIVDWKTGKHNQSVKDQLRTYGMFALKNGWTKNVKNIVMLPVFLGEQDANKIEIPLRTDMSDLIKQADIIRKEWPLLVDAQNSRNDISKFPITDNVRSCISCHFREMCEGADRLK